jgi:hypothetical protein
MNDALFSTFAALAGTLVGAVSTFATTWLTQSLQGRSTRRAAEYERRQALYGRYAEELARLHAVALPADRFEYAEFTEAFALKGRIMLFAPPHVVAAVEDSLKAVMDLCLAPPVSPERARALLDEGLAVDWIKRFALEARRDLETFEVV